MQSASAALIDLPDIDLRKPKGFGLGGLRPAHALAPRTFEALAHLLARCSDIGAAVVVWGGGTMQGVGYAPERYDVAIVMDQLCAVVDYEPHDLTIAVQGGMRVAALMQTLAANGQFVPLDAPRAASATVGGTLASGWIGPRRGMYGRPRDLVIGATAILANGTIAKAGGMVVKNVTGYDASKLYIGACGTLGVIARANFKTLPKPPRSRIAVAPLPERTAQRAIEHVNMLAIEPAASLVISGFGASVEGEDSVDGRLFVLLEGSEAVVERATRDLRSALGSAGVPKTTIIDNGAGASFGRLLDAYVAPAPSAWVTYRSFHLPQLADEYRGQIVEKAQQHRLIADTIVDARNGDVTVRLQRSDAALIDDAFVAFDTGLREIAPNAAIIAGDAALRETLEPWGAAPPGFEKMRALKLQFDPSATLAPGRFLGRI